MQLVTKGLTPDQERVLESNFVQAGPLYQVQDLHPMLDCACAPEPWIRFGVTGKSGLLDQMFSVPFRAKLREEFFGGILYDCVNHRHYMLNHEAFHVFKQFGEEARPGHHLIGQLDHDRGEETLQHLVGAGLIAASAEVPDMEVFGARDLSLAYLQSPIIVEVEVTYGCFRTCKHCAYESSPDARRPDELTAPQWAEIFRKLAAAGVLIVQLTGGDPLFRDDSFDIVQAASDAGMSVYVRSDTAALSPANVRRLKDLPGLWHVGTSMDGADATSHDWMRGKGAFSTLQKRVEILAAAGIDVSVGATLHRGNYASVRKIGQAAVSFGAKWFDIGFLSPVGRGVQLQDLVLDGSQTREALDLYLEGIRAGDYVPSHSHYLRRADSDQPFNDLATLVDRMPYLTEWPFSRLRLDPTGSSYTAGKLKGSDYAGGFNLTSCEVEQVWDHSPNLVQLRELGAGGRIHSLDYRLLRSSHEFMG
ncbi:radical SAM protein [Actinoplanes sp. NPDC049118]|uniref:radical SAM protein n=1 Tax=Actinoplanes sp. NPDC049118 TaxID=3155769 RepID=UPI0033CF7F21